MQKIRVDIEKIKQLKNKGYSVRTISVKMRVSERTIYRRLKTEDKN